MDNAYEYLNEKNVLLEEAKMLDVEKHKNVGADMKTVNKTLVYLNLKRLLVG